MHRTFFKKTKAVADPPDDAETIAALALAFVAEDATRLGRFMSSTGLDPATLGRMAGTREIAGAVLGYLLEDETLLLTFAANHRLRPERLAPLHAELSGGGRSREGAES